MQLSCSDSVPLINLQSSGMSLDALDALGDTLGVAEVEPEAPKPLPKDIVQVLG